MIINKRIIKILSLLANYGLIMFFAYLFLVGDNIDRHYNAFEVMMICLTFTFLVLNIAAISMTDDKESDNIISLFFKRKMLEEKNKIRDLESK